MAKLLNIFDGRDKIGLIVLLFLFIFSGIIEVVGIASVAPFIALLTKPEYLSGNSFYQNTLSHYSLSNTEATVIMGVLVIILFALSNIVTAYTLWKSVSFTAFQQHKISMNSFKKYLYQPYDFYVKTTASSISKNILHETGIICDLVILPALQFLSKLFIIFSISIFLLYLNHQIFISSVLFLGLVYLMIYTSIKNKLDNYGKTKIIMNKEKYKCVGDAFADIKSIKFYSTEDSYLNIFNKPAKSFAYLTAKSTLFSTLPRYILEIIAFGSIFMVLIYFLSQNYNLLAESPIIAVFIIAAYRALPLMQQVYQNYTIYKFNSPVIDIIRDIYGLTIDNNKKCTIKKFDQSIIFDNISFSYDSMKIISDLSLEIKKSQTIAIVGDSGSGKTTLIDILLGFNRNYKGKIIIDGNHLTHIELLGLRNMIGYVSQDTSLTYMSLEENIAFGQDKKDIDYDLIRDVISVTQLKDFVEDLEQGLQSILTEGGSNISGGQKNRVLIARALYRKPKILILDEATSAFNEELEKKILTNIKNYLPGITIILVTHRKSSLQFCNKVFHMRLNDNQTDIMSS